MNFLIKIEDLINKVILLIQEQIAKLIPTPFKNAWMKVCAFFSFLLTWIKHSPVHLKNFVLWLIQKVKTPLSVNYKAKLIKSYQLAQAKYKETKPDYKSGTFKQILLAPFLLLREWMGGLSPMHSLVLLGFTALSILSVGGMAFFGHNLAMKHVEANRVPASAEEEVTYDRPNYYKQQTRFFEVNNIRLPVHFVQVNEIRSVDIDFTGTLSNRQSKQFIEKLEFQLRDHLVLQVEPVVSTFPLEEEGKEIIRQKLKAEINDFMKQNKIEGEVLEIKLTYILAN